MAKPTAPQTVLNFLEKENRPYAINEILEKCGKDFGKAAVQKALEGLEQKDKITAKCFGKQKIYFVKQEADVVEFKKDLQAQKLKLSQTQHEVKQIQSKFKELEAKLKSADKIRSIESLEEEQSQLMDEIRELNEKLLRQKAKATTIKLTPSDVETIEKNYERVANAYRKRKRICADMLDAILEGYPKSKKVLIEDIGLETDEDAGFNVEIKQ